MTVTCIYGPDFHIGYPLVSYIEISSDETVLVSNKHTIKPDHNWSEIKVTK